MKEQSANDFLNFVRQQTGCVVTLPCSNDIFELWLAQRDQEREAALVEECARVAESVYQAPDNVATSIRSLRSSAAVTLELVKVRERIEEAKLWAHNWFGGPQKDCDCRDCQRLADLKAKEAELEKQMHE